MAKILSGNCAAGIVLAESFPVATATILSAGLAPSTGVVVMDEGNATYITSNASDIKDILQQLDSILTQIIAALIAIDGVTLSPGTSTAFTTQLTILKTTLALKQELLK
jgi:hypothetical protein